MSTLDNPLGREYTREEWAAGVRQGVARMDRRYDDASLDVKSFRAGPMIFATGDYYPDMARKAARDWALIADAMEREWVKTTLTRKDTP